MEALEKLQVCDARNDTEGYYSDLSSTRKESDSTE